MGGGLCGSAKKAPEYWFRMEGGFELVSKEYQEIELENAKKFKREIDRSKHVVICRSDHTGPTTKTNCTDTWGDGGLQEFTHENLGLKKDPERTRIGILGGMGPLPAAEFLVELVDALSRADNLDHSKIDIVLLSNPDYQLAADGIQLADLAELSSFKRAQTQYQKFVKSDVFQCMMAPCNTFHIMVHCDDDKIVDDGFATTMIEKLAKFDINKDTFVSLVESVGKYVKSHYDNQKIGLLATKNTYSFGMYKNILMPNCVSIKEAEEKSQEGINAVKKGDLIKAEKLFLDAIEIYAKQDVKVILLGCTEIPLACSQEAVDKRFPNQGITTVSTLSCGVEGVVDKLRSVWIGGSDTEDALSPESPDAGDEA